MRKINAHWKAGELGEIADEAKDLGVKARTVMMLYHMLEKRQYKHTHAMVQWVVLGPPVSRKELEEFKKEGVHSLDKAEA